MCCTTILNFSSDNLSNVNNSLINKPEYASSNKFDRPDKSNNNPQMPDSSSDDGDTKSIRVVDSKNAFSASKICSKTDNVVESTTDPTIPSSGETIDDSVHSNSTSSIDTPAINTAYLNTFSNCNASGNTSTHNPDRELAEEDAMRELLNRSDTAIIYPEPVSDNEEETEYTHTRGKSG